MTPSLRYALKTLVGPWAVLPVVRQAGIRSLLPYTALTVTTGSLAGPVLVRLPPVVLTAVCMSIG